jgi:CheY-like chemotaxis protein
MEGLEALPERLVGDPMRLRQILINLVGNAIKFTDRGQVTLRARTEEKGERVLVRIEVEDSGIGISEATQANLFTRFSQADSSTTRKYGGTGLGLAICKQLVDLMGGEIALDSDPRTGSRFWFTVRCQIAQPQRSADGLGLTGVARPRRGLRILVAEDNQVNQLLVSALLRRLGCQVDLVSNGLEAISAVQRIPYDLILMDVQMPEMDGIAASQAIRRLPGEVRRIPIVALTANAMAGQREEYIEAGMDEYVSKPIDMAQLMGAMTRLCGPEEADETAPVEETPPAPAPAGGGKTAADETTTDELSALIDEIDQQTAPRTKTG